MVILKRNMKKLLLAASVAATIGFSGCGDVNIYKLEAHQGAYVLNKGTNESTVSYYNYEREECTNDYYQKKNNGNTIGSGASSMVIRKSSEYAKGVAFVTLPSENAVEMINVDGFTSISSIDDFTSPTDVLQGEEGVIYVCHGGNKVSSYNTSTHEVIKEFTIGTNPQKLISSGKFLYAACAGDGTGAKVFVIDMSNEVKVDTVDFAYNNPIDMVVDIDRKVWVYCDDTEQVLVKLDRQFVTETLEEDTPNERDTTYLTNEPINFSLGARMSDSANPLTISNDGRILYYVYGKLCANSVYIETEDDLNQDVSIVSGDYKDVAFNGIDYDPRTRRITALTSDGKLVVLRNYDDVWNDEEFYEVGENPFMTSFNF